jgi:hypothetical protein
MLCADQTESAAGANQVSWMGDLHAQADGPTHPKGSSAVQAVQWMESWWKVKQLQRRLYELLDALYHAPFLATNCAVLSTIARMSGGGKITPMALVCKAKTRHSTHAQAQSS